MQAGITDRLAELDPYREPAVRLLVEWLLREPEALIAVARGRHAEGDYRYGTSGMYQLGLAELTAEAAQELGDAINYLALRLSRT